MTLLGDKPRKFVASRVVGCRVKERRENALVSQHFRLADKRPDMRHCSERESKEAKIIFHKGFRELQEEFTNRRSPIVLHSYTSVLHKILPHFIANSNK